jgi:hypothetical protein
VNADKSLQIAHKQRRERPNIHLNTRASSLRGAGSGDVAIQGGADIGDDGRDPNYRVRRMAKGDPGGGSPVSGRNRPVVRKGHASSSIDWMTVSNGLDFGQEEAITKSSARDPTARTIDA